MKIRALAANGIMTSQLRVDAGLTGACFSLDARPIYDLPADEWPDFCSAMLTITALPPDIPANQWATAAARSEGCGCV